MLIPRSFAYILFVGIPILGAGAVISQDYPNKPIRIFATEVRGSADVVTRLLAPGLVSALGQQVIVENRNSIISPDLVAKALPDGHTLLLNGPSLWLAPFLQKVSFDPVRDLAPITTVTSAPLLLVVHPSLPVKSVKELIALAKARPGELNVGTGSTGGSPHLAAELFNVMAGVDIAPIKYKGAGFTLTAVLGGEVQLMFSTSGIVTPHVSSGRLRALAVTSAQPSMLAPGLPTVAESGLPNFESVSMLGMFAPAKTPETIINRLNQELVRLLGTSDIKEKMLKVGTQAVGSTPERFGTAVKSEMARWGKVIKDVGIRPE